jgi:pseudouridine-5'-phosphate glycosidase
MTIQWRHVDRTFQAQAGGIILPTALPIPEHLAIVRLPAERQHANNTQTAGQEEKGVDEKRKTPHNLTSLLQRTQRFVARQTGSTELAL